MEYDEMIEGIHGRLKPGYYVANSEESWSFLAECVRSIVMKLREREEWEQEQRERR